MTVSSENRRNRYVGDGNNDTYDYTFRILAESDLKVVKADDAGAETTLVLNTDYTVAGVGNAGGGTIKLTAGNLAFDHVLVILREPHMLQETDLRNQGGYFPDTVENALDRLVMLHQSQEEEIARSVRLPETTASDVEPVLAAPKAGRYVAWSSDGKSLVNKEADPGTLTSGTASGQVLRWNPASEAYEPEATGPGASKVPTNADLRVTTLSALKALAAPSTDQTVFMLGRTPHNDGGQGQFTWRSGDQSANVTADTGGGVWVPPDSDATGASGAWQRAYSGLPSAAWWGATGDGATDDRAAFFNANAYGDFTVPPGTYSIGTALTLSSNVVIQAGAILKPANGVTLTIDKEPQAGDYQVFDTTAGGTVSVRGTRRPEWWGCACDGVTDDLAAFRATFTGLNSGDKVVGRAGTYKINQSVANNGNPVIDLTTLTDLDFDFSNSHINCSDSTNTDVPALFKFTDCGRVSVDVKLWERFGPAYNSSNGFVVQAIGACHGITLNKGIGLSGTAKHGDGLFQAFDSVGDGTGTRGSRFEAWGYADTSQYGVNFAFSGDGSYVNFRTKGVLRSLFPYGIDGLTGSYQSNGSEGVDLNLNQLGTGPTAYIKNVDITAHILDANWKPVQISDGEGTAVSTIENIKLNLVVTNPKNRLEINTTISGTVFRNIDISLKFDGENRADAIAADSAVFVNIATGTTIESLKMRSTRVENTTWRPFRIQGAGTKRHIGIDGFYAEAENDLSIDGATNVALFDFYLHNTTKTSTGAQLGMTNCDVVFIGAGECHGVLSSTGTTNLTQSGFVSGTGNVR